MKIRLSLITITAICILGACSKSGPSNPPTQNIVLPTVSNLRDYVLVYGTNLVTFAGNVTDDGGATVTARGICWSDATQSPLVTGDHTVDGSGKGTFTGVMTTLSPGVLYFVRAYATNSKGTAYSNTISFTTTPGGAPSGDYYATGMLDFGTPFSIPTVWKNGLPTPITAGSKPAQANSVFVSGTSFYVAGYERNGAVDMAKVWKDGNGTFLTTVYNGGGAGRSVFVSGSNVYVAGESMGTSNNMATIWKNNVATILTSGTSPGGANSVCVAGGVDVYVAGYDGNVAKLWKNGVATLLSDGTNTAVANWVCFFYPDSYVAGTEMIGTKTAAKIWKNNTGTFLTDGSFNAVANSVYVRGTASTTDVFVVGYENNGTKNVAKFWKNGVATSLTDGTKDAAAYSVHGAGADVYIGGYEFDGTKNVAKLWKNGLEIALQNSASAGFLTGIFVQ